MDPSRQQQDQSTLSTSPSRRQSSRPTSSLYSTSPSSDNRRMPASTMRRSVAGGRQTSVTSDDSADAVRLTKTGRLSKAKKGQPVHKCDHCDKIYTRAEHLRRHMLNHSNQTLRCEFEGCQKSFHRADLLARHMDEHKSANYGASRASSSKPVTSTKSSPKKTSVPFDPVHCSKNSQNVPSNQMSYTQSYPSPVSICNSPPGPYWHAWTSPASVDLSACGSGFDSYPMPDFCDPYPFQGQVPYPTPGLYETDEWLSKTNMSGSRSPVSVASSSAPWQRNEPFGRHRSMFSPSNSDYSGYQTSEPFSADLGPIALDPAFDGGLIEDVSWNTQDIFDQDMIRAYLSNPDLLPLISMESYESQFIDHYWNDFHPIYPIIHRPTYEAKGGSPLLKALMLAIGAQFVRKSHAQSFATTMRDISLKLLRQRQPNQIARLCDLQCVFLAEVLSLYRARRPWVKFSAHFETMCSSLARDTVDVLSSEPTTATDAISSRHDIESLAAVQKTWMCIEAKRRLFLSCYILQVQQNMFFGCGESVAETDLPLPCSNDLWEVTDLSIWYDLARIEPLEPHYLFDALSMAQRRRPTSYDTFQSAIIAAYFAHSQDASHPHVSDFLLLIEQSPQTLFSYHAANLGRLTPIKPLLAVSGESFVLGEKLATRGQFEEATAVLQKWRNSNFSAIARQHACELLRIRCSHGRLNLLQEEWVLSLAALVFWACGIWNKESTLSSLATTTTPPSVEDVLHLIAHVELDADASRSIIAWVRSTTPGTIGGAVEDINQVLKKLVEGSKVGACTA